VSDDYEPPIELVAAVTSLVRRIDPEFEKEGGSTRHWVRDWFLPGLDEAGYEIVRKDGGPLAG
jgi:hypothetical protein